MKFDDATSKQTTTLELPLGEINPYIRMASKHSIEGGFNTGIRINVHYQLHYVFGGKGTMIINDQTYHLSVGDFLIWGPGDVHQILSDMDAPLEVIGIQFDMTRNHCDRDYPCIHLNKLSFSWDKVNEVINITEINELAPYSKVREQGSIMGYLEDVVKSFESRSPYAQQIMSGLLKSTLSMVFEEKTKKTFDGNPRSEVIRDILLYMKEHHNEKLTNTLLGEKFGYHPNHLNQLVLNHTGFTIQQYLIHIRMNKAIDLLVHTHQPIGEIGDRVGGYSIHYFSRLFKSKTGLNPSDFRK